MGKLRAIPARFRDCTFETYVPVNSRQRDAKQQMESDRLRSFFLFGNYAQGKTHLAFGQYRTLIQTEEPAMFYTMAELLAELRKGELDSDYLSIVVDRVRYAERFHLFIDDIDKFKVTDFKFEVLFDLIDTIYKRKLGLTITSNFGLRGLVESERLHPSIVRRIDDTCTALEV